MDSTTVRQKAAPAREMIKLSEAARRLGYHVETLRLRVRRGELAASRGAHGTYYVTPATMAEISPPRRSARRAIALETLDWSWYAIEQLADDQGASYGELGVIGQIRRNPALSKALHRLFTVQRLRLAGLTSAEIADHTRLSKRQVRRLTHRDVKKSLQRLRRSQADDDRDDVEEEEEEEEADADLEWLLDQRLRRRSLESARKAVAEIQRRLDNAGLQYHHRIPKPLDKFVARGRAVAAVKVWKLSREVRRHLLDGGLSPEQITAIRVAGIGQDELNELILRGLPPGPQ
ncbi:MAG: hypothetical protein ACYDA0_10160 [Candidatus Dormibacteraceae bacterium]